MTNQEAVEMIRNDIKLHHDALSGKYRKALSMAISALENQIPKKPGYTKLMYKCNGEDLEINHPECPYCRTHGLSLWDAAIPVGDKYCKRCGQAIDWTESE